MTDKEMEFDELLKQAEAGDVDAMYNLSIAYYYGSGTEVDLKRYFEWMERSALQNNKDAMFYLSLAYYHGSGTEIDLKKYFEWMERSALQNNKDAMFYLSLAYYHGYGTEIDLQKHFEWSEKAALEKNENAVYNLSIAYYYGYGTEIDLKKYFEWTEKSALENNKDAMFNLSLAYWFGYGTIIDLVKYFEWIKKAADAGVPKATFNLGNAYYSGWGTEKNLEQALMCYLKAGDLGLSMGYWSIIVAPEFKKPYFKDDYKRALNRYLELYFPAYIDFIVLAPKLSDDFSAFIKLLIDVENEHLYSPRLGEKLYHYTGQIVIQKLLNIDIKQSDNKNEFESRLRLYMASYLNDPTEGRYIFDFKFESDIQGLDYIRNVFEPFSQDQDCLVNDRKDQIYSLSFSENSDNLNLWRAYGRGANGEANGVNIGIPYETLKQFNAMSTVGISAKQFLHAEDKLDKEVSSEGLFLLYKVKYGEDSVKNMWGKIAQPLNKLLKKIQKQYPKKDDDYTDYQLFYCVYLAMSRLMYLYKHDAYAAEEEVRALAMGGLTDPNLMADERSPARLYFNTPAILFQHKDSEIILGPQMSPEDKAVLVWSLRKRVVDLKLGDKVTIKSSTVPFR